LDRHDDGEKIGYGWYATVLAMCIKAKNAIRIADDQ
jgi:hypothetical protein